MALIEQYLSLFNPFQFSLSLFPPTLTTIPVGAA
jgi:hypothetical protein